MTDLQSNPLVGEQAAVQGAVGRVVPHEILDAEAEQVAPVSLSPGLLAWRKFRRHKLAMASAIFLIFMCLTAIFADQISRYPYEATGVGPVFQGPTSAHWFGTDAIGRDLYSRIIYGLSLIHI